MEGGSRTPTGAVFLSYASQDAEPAQRICDALRAGGVELWLDKSELRGGDAWDRSIRQQIHDCALFVPAFSFKGKDVKIGTIARELNVGAVLEGTVRRSGNTIRISTELINAVTGKRCNVHSPSGPQSGRAHGCAAMTLRPNNRAACSRHSGRAILSHRLLG